MASSLATQGLQFSTSVMLESNLVGGAQKFPQPLAELTYGQSITDACIDWPTTAALLREAAATR